MLMATPSAANGWLYPRRRWKRIQKPLSRSSMRSTTRRRGGVNVMR
jgi:hypothetical protein